MQNRSEGFGRLLKGAINSIATYEGKTAPVIEEELGAAIGLTGATIQRYKSGYLPPEPRSIQILATAAVQRGFVSREWLQRFLHAARYPAPEPLLEALCPQTPARARGPRSYHNLPPPAYSQFVMRHQAYAELVDGLQQRSPVVVLASMGGMGKTSLAREVAARCLLGDGDAPRFDAVVWVSDKDRPGTTTLTSLLDEIVRTLDYPGFTQFAHDEKLREVEHLLRRQQVLLVVDNFETINDGALLAWLLRLPEPSKALITTREYRREFRRGGWPVELRGMQDDEARALIAERLRVLKIDRLVSDLAQLEPLIQATGGNPLAIELGLGLLKYSRRPLQQVVDDLYAARGELFDDLFARNWALLDEPARRVLLAMTRFPAHTASPALAATSGIQGFGFDVAVERLTDLALLDVEQADLAATPLYVLHPLVRALALARLAELPLFAAEASQRWQDYFVALLQDCDRLGWDRPEPFERIEQEAENMHALLHACDAPATWPQLVSLVLMMCPFWSTRGYYDTRSAFIERALDAARQINDQRAQVQLLCIKVRALCYQDDATAALACCDAARTRLAALPAPDPALTIALNNAQIRAWVRSGNTSRVMALAEQNVTLAQRHSERHYLLARFDIAEQLARQGQHDQAAQLFAELAEQSLAIGYLRAPIQAWLGLAGIALQRNDVGSAARFLALAQERAELIGHRRFLAESLRLSGHLHLRNTDHAAARAAFSSAVDLFERLGMRRELRETQAAIDAQGPGIRDQGPGVPTA